MTTHVISDMLAPREQRMRDRLPLDIELEPNDDRIKLRPKRFDVKYTEADVQEYNGRFIEILEKVRRDVARLGKNINQPLASGEEYLEDLRQVGVEAYALLPEGLGERIRQQEREERERGISLDFTFPVPMAYLWEMVYAGDPRESLDFEKFWGYRYPIGHLQWDCEVKRLVKLQRGILASAHDQLLFSREELEQLGQRMRELRNRLHLAVDIQRLEEVISSEMASCKELIKFFTGRTFDYGVVHFACHCANPDAQGKGVSRAYLSFTAHREVEMTLGQFNSEARFNRGFLSRPLVFLNACESGTPLHLQSLNFPSALINFGASGVIATACTLPDNFASAFATKFYSRLFDKFLAGSSLADTLPVAAGSPYYVGEALWETSRYFWKAYRNPLGLAYGLYAESNQELDLTSS